MSLGIALTRFKVFSFKKALVSTNWRVILGSVVGFLIISFSSYLDLSGGIFIQLLFMPSAILNYLD